MTFSLQRIAATIVAVGTTVGTILAIVLNLATTVHVPSAEVAIIVAASSIVAAIVNEFTQYAAPKIAAKITK